jgi:opacity protein-like surface antigen
MNCKEFQPKVALALAMIGFAAMTNFSLPARGADYERPFPPPAPTYDMVEFASGWYVRGDIAYAQETFPKISSLVTFDPTLSPAFAINQSQSSLNTFSAGAGMGYKINDWFRTDLVLDYRSPVQAGVTGPSVRCITAVDSQGNVTGTDICTSHLNSAFHRWDLLANGYIDLATWQGFTPYVGAGAGISWARIKQSVTWTQTNGLPYVVSTNGFFFDLDRSLGTQTYRFAWALMAGLSVAVAEHVQLDAGYRFLNLGTVSGISAVTGAQTTQRVIANEIRGGLRYTID